MSPSSPSWRPRCRFSGAADGMTARRIASAILLAGFAVMLAMNAPGQLSYDSVSQLADGRAGFYNSWHPPVMAWLLGLFDRLVPGTLLFLIFQSLLLLAALLALLWLQASRLGERGAGGRDRADAAMAALSGRNLEGHPVRRCRHRRFCRPGLLCTDPQAWRRWSWRRCFWRWPPAPARTAWCCCRWRR